MTCASVSKSRLPDDLRRRTILQTVNRSMAESKLDLSRRAPLARTRTLPNSGVDKVAIRLVSLQSVVRTTRAVAFSAAIYVLTRLSLLIALVLLGGNIGQFQSRQVIPFALAHFRRCGGIFVIVTAQMQEAVD